MRRDFLRTGIRLFSTREEEAMLVGSDRSVSYMRMKDLEAAWALVSEARGERLALTG